MSALLHRQVGFALLLLVQIGSARPIGETAGIGNLDLPRGMQTDPIGERLRINGVETRVWQFRSTDGVDAVATHFSREWSGKIARSNAGGWDILSHRDGEWLITVQSGPADALGVHRGFIAIARLFVPRDRLRAEPPRLPRTQLLQDIEAEDLGRPSRTMLLLSEESAAQNLEFYRAHFRAEGFVPLAAGALTQGPDGGSLSLTRRGEHLDIGIAERGGRSWITIVRVLP